MIQIIKKSEQFNDVIFDGRFHANKPIFNGKANTKPYSYLYYWSNGYINEYCEFGLHPHQGFEIMTFLFEGTIEHFDTTTRLWTPLHAGDFQIIQSNSGIHHKERISKNSRAFQIWFDPNFDKAIKLMPKYTDYHSNDFQPKNENGRLELTYIGNGSNVKTLTPNLTIKKIIFKEQTKTSLQLNETMSYTIYILNGKGVADNHIIQIDDAIRISGADKLDLDFQGELFYIETPTILEYNPVWMQKKKKKKSDISLA